MAHWFKNSAGWQLSRENTGHDDGWSTGDISKVAGDHLDGNGSSGDGGRGSSFDAEHRFRKRAEPRPSLFVSAPSTDIGLPLQSWTWTEYRR
jgi:hypothetical protein